MKKLSLLLLSAFVVGDREGVKAVKIFLLAFIFSCISSSVFAQVTVGPAGGGTNICYTSAVGGASPSCTTLGNITLTETTPADFASGSDVLELTPPPGWIFCSSTSPTLTPAGGGDIISATVGSFTPTLLTINITTTGTASPDLLTITGLQVQPTGPSVSAGYISATATTTGIAGVVTGVAGTDFGDLQELPGIISGLTSHCTGDVQNYDGGVVPGGVWGTTAGGIATVNTAGDVTFGPGTGIVSITYGFPGCTKTFGPITVSKTPRHSYIKGPIRPLKDLCAWFDNIYVFNDDSLGTFTSGTTGVSGAVTVFGALFTGHALVQANAPGTDIVYFHTPAGCIVSDTFEVWPLPSVITGNDTVCVGSTTLLSNAITGGIWSSVTTTIATIGSTTGIVTGVGAGIDTIKYGITYTSIRTSSMTTCYRDTLVVVNPLPGIITGTASMCLGQTTQLTDATPGGAWSSSNTSVATINSSGLASGIAFGTATITYTLTTGCYATIDVTVNPVPVAITATQSSECVGDSVIILSDLTSGGTWVTMTASVATVSGTGAVYGVLAGTATISYVLSTGCGVGFTVTINPLPLPITGPDSVCVGSTVVLSDATPYTGSIPPGAWSSSITTVAVIDPAGFCTGVSAGTTTITYKLSTGCYTTRVETVNPLPAPITGVHVLCVAHVWTLSDATFGGTWTSSNTSIATVDPVSGDVLGVSSTIGRGVVLITYTVSTGCYVTWAMTITPVPTTITGPSTVCVGQSITLSNGVSGGIWTSGDTTIATIDSFTGVVIGKSSGTVGITYTVGPFCDISFVLAVNPLTPILGPTTVCAGDSILLIDSTVPGTFITLNPLVATVHQLALSVVDSAEVTGVAPGGVVSIVYTTAAGCSDTMDITVFNNAPITGITDSVCVGSTITLSNSVSGGLWTSSSTTIATVNPLTGVVTGVGSGTILIFYTLPTGCISQFLVRVNSIPDTIQATSHTVCQGYTVVFSNTFAGGVWSNVYIDTGTIVATGSLAGTYTGLGGGLDTIHYTLGTGCFVTDTVRVFPLTPITGFDTVCVGLTTTLSDATTGGIWSSDNTTVATIGSSTGVVTGIAAGTATITYLLPTGCQAVDTVVVNPNPVGITGQDTLCTGTMTTLSDADLGGTWSISNTSIATIDSITGVVTGVGPGTATVTYTLPTGCLTLDTILVNLTPPGITGPSYVCIGFTTLLSDAIPGGTWSSTNLTIDTVGLTTGLVQSISPGVDTIIYTITSTGCNIGLTFTVFAPPVITITHRGLMCKGDTISILADGADFFAPYRPGSYTWAPSYALSSTVGALVIGTPTITTTYTVIGTTYYNCKDTVTTTIQVDTLLNHLKIVGNDTICIGACTTLNASGRDGSLFAWTPTTGLSCTICDTTIACPTETTKYEATAIDRIGCKDSVDFTVYVMPLPILTATSIPNGFPITLCRGTPLQLIAYGAWSYVWSPNLFLSCDSCANPVATDTFNMQYLLTGYTRFGCSDSIKVKVSVLDTNINFVLGDTDICYNTSAQLLATSSSVTSNLDIPTFAWSPAYGLDDPTSSHPIATPLVTTTYTVVITENACFKDTVEVKVSVQPYPQISLTPTSELVYAGTAVLMTATVTNTPIATWAWTPIATIACDTCPVTYATPTAPITTYTITATSIYHCVSYDTVTISIGCDSKQVYIPNTFTPNGDGMNDRFYVSGKGLKTITLFNIYNRWGQLIYHNENINPNDPAQGWDGTYKGEVLAPDVFVYVVKAICELGGDSFEYKGDVSLVR